MTTTTCTCLTAYDADLAHAASCELATAASYGALRDLRDLAELAANSDIDTAIGVFRTLSAKLAQAGVR